MAVKRIGSVFAALAALVASCHAEGSRSSARAPDIRVDTGIDTGRITIPGGSLYWQSAGTGAPVVLILFVAVLCLLLIGAVNVANLGRRH